MIPGIILAGGNSTRIGDLTVNKVVLPFHGKPMIVRAVESISDSCQPIFVVVGAYRESVIKTLKNYQVEFVDQLQRLGTADAVSKVIPHLKKLNPDFILVGYGDNMMLNTGMTIKNLIAKHLQKKSTITFISTVVMDSFGLGRVVKDKNNKVVDIVEEKEATEIQKEIKTVNTGIYCINFNFLINNINKIEKSKISGEYYLTDLVKIAGKQHLPVYDYCVGYEQVGGGVNTLEQLDDLSKIALH